MPQMQMVPGELGRRAQEAFSRTAGLAVQNMAIQDFAMVAFHSYMCFRVMMAPDTAGAAIARSSTFALLAISVMTLALTRCEILGPGPIRSAVYRIGMLGPMVGSYFTLKWLLPAIQPRLLDGELLAIDSLLFGHTPAHFLDRFVSFWSVEWFAFFYYLYFYVLAVHILGSMAFDTGRRLQEITFGSMAVVAIGHTLYTMVPGVGPYVDYAFQNRLEGGFFWRQVVTAVAAAGAQLDIFPSLHTAYPTFFALHAFRYRMQNPYRYTWIPTVFIAANIVAATVFLRWHYGVDVIAGLILAVAAQRLAVAVAERERDRAGYPNRQPVWEPLR